MECWFCGNYNNPSYNFNCNGFPFACIQESKHACAAPAPRRFGPIFASFVAAVVATTREKFVATMWRYIRRVDRRCVRRPGSSLQIVAPLSSPLVALHGEKLVAGSPPRSSLRRRCYICCPLAYMFTYTRLPKIYYHR